MITELEQHLAGILNNDPGVKESYEHVPKRVTPGESIVTDGAVLKWYRLGASRTSSEDRHVPDEIDRLARSYLTKNTLEATGLGFVILHRCGNDFYFLIVSTWRGNNELWETVFYKDGEKMTDFAPWPRDGLHKPTFCVWELAPVWHETKSWERFLISARDEAAAQIWQRDLYSGPA